MQTALNSKLEKSGLFFQICTMLIQGCALIGIMLYTCIMLRQCAFKVLVCFITNPCVGGHSKA